MDDLHTPFRERFERSLDFDVQASIEACADYLQHPDVLIAEFLESYYLVERKLDPELADAMHEASTEELVLEPFFDSLELRVGKPGRFETIRCIAGAFSPIAGEVHPALERSGVDYIGMRDGSPNVVLGVSDLDGEASAFSLLLRGLNCLAELATPFQLTRLRRHVLRDRLDPEGIFELQLGIPKAARSDLDTSLLVLCRDLAEVFKERVRAAPQFDGQIGRIECLEIGDEGVSGVLRPRWRV